MAFSCDTGARLLAMHVGEPYNRVVVYHWRGGKVVCDDEAPPGVRGHRLAFNPEDWSQVTLSWTSAESRRGETPGVDPTLKPNKLAHGGSSGMQMHQRRSSVIFAEQEAAAAAVAAGVAGGLRMWRIREGVEAALQRYPPFQGLGERCDVTDYQWLPDSRLIVLLERSRVAVVTDGVVRQELFPAAGLPGGTDMADDDSPHLLSVAMHGLGFAVGASDGSLLVYMPESITRARRQGSEGGHDESWFRIARRVVVYSPFRESVDRRTTPVMRLSPSPGTDILCVVTGVPSRNQHQQQQQQRLTLSPQRRSSAEDLLHPVSSGGRDRPEGPARLRCIGLWDVEQAVRADTDEDDGAVGPIAAEVTWRLTGGHAGNIVAASVCPSAALIATVGADDGCVVVWDASSRTIRAARSYPMASPPVDVSLHPSGHWVAVAVTRAGAEQLALTGDHLVSDVTFVRGRVEVGAIACGKQGGLVAIGAAGVTVISSLFAGPSGAVGALARLEGHAGTAQRFEWLRHDTQLLSAGDDGSMFLYDLSEIPNVAPTGAPLHKSQLTRPALDAARRATSVVPQRAFTLPGDPRSRVPSMRIPHGDSSLQDVFPMVLSRVAEADRPPGGSSYRGMCWLAPTPLAEGTILAVRPRADLPLDPGRANASRASSRRRGHRAGGHRSGSGGKHAGRNRTSWEAESERRWSIVSAESVESAESAGSPRSDAERGESGGSSRHNLKWRYPKPGGGGGGVPRGDNRERSRERSRERRRRHGRQTARRSTPPVSRLSSRPSSRSEQEALVQGDDNAVEGSRPGTAGSESVVFRRPATHVSATTHPWEFVSWWGGRVADELESAVLPVRDAISAFAAIRLTPARWSAKEQRTFVQRWVDEYSPSVAPARKTDLEGDETEQKGQGLGELAAERAREAEARAFTNDMAVWCGTEDGRLGLLSSATGVDVDENSVAAMLENDRHSAGGRWLGVHAGAIGHLHSHLEGGWLVSAGAKDGIVAVMVSPWLVARNSGNGQFLPVLSPALVDANETTRPGTPVTPRSNRRAALLWRRWHHAVGVLIRDGLVATGRSSSLVMHSVSSKEAGVTSTDGELGDAAVILDGVRPGDPVFGGQQVPMQLVPRSAWHAVGKRLEEETERSHRLEQEQEAALRDLRSTLEAKRRDEEEKWEHRLEQERMAREQEREEARLRAGKLEAETTRLDRRHRGAMEKVEQESREALEACRAEKEKAEQRAIDAEFDLRVQVEELEEKRKVAEQHILDRFKEAMQEEKRKQEELRQYLHFVRDEYESEADRNTERNDHEVIRLRETAAAAETSAQQSRVDARVRVASLQTEVERLQTNLQRMREERDGAERASADRSAQVKVLEERLQELKRSMGASMGDSALHLAEVAEERKRAELMNRSRMIVMRELESMQASKAPAEAQVAELGEKVRQKDEELLEWKNRTESAERRMAEMSNAKQTAQREVERLRYTAHQLEARLASIAREISVAMDRRTTSRGGRRDAALQEAAQWEALVRRLDQLVVAKDVGGEAAEQVGRSESDPGLAEELMRQRTRMKSAVRTLEHSRSRAEESSRVTAAKLREDNTSLMQELNRYRRECTVLRRRLEGERHTLKAETLPARPERHEGPERAEGYERRSRTPARRTGSRRGAASLPTLLPRQDEGFRVRHVALTPSGRKRPTSAMHKKQQSTSSRRG